MNFEGGKKNTSGLFAILAELTVQTTNTVATSRHF